MCLAQGPQRSDAGEARTRSPSVSSQALYHWATENYNYIYIRYLQTKCKYLSYCMFNKWFIKLPFVIKIFVLSIFEWPFYTGFTECITYIYGPQHKKTCHRVYKPVCSATETRPNIEILHVAR